MGYRFERLKILVVDDSQSMRTLVSTLLKAFGVKDIYGAGSAEEAWRILDTQPCDIIILDWVLKGMSGLEFAERVRTAAESPNPVIPIVMLTGYSSAERVHAARDAGVNEFLAKPVSAKGVFTRLAAVIEHPRPFVRTKVYFGPCRRRRRDANYVGPERRESEVDAEYGGKAATKAPAEA
jgi:two-component system, chemotaxis family, chemotaxis protein CheY